MLAAAIHGVILAIGLIIPIGMQNGFIIFQGALHRRWINALPTVITAGISDTLLIGLGVMGVSTAVFQIPWLRYTIGGIGVLFLLFMGWSSWKENTQSNEIEIKITWSVQRQIVYTLSVSLLNPHALIDTLAVMGGSSLVYTSISERVSFWIACSLVSWIWFLLLSIIGHWTGRMALKNTKRLINRISAIIMWSSAIYLAYLIFTLKI